MSKNVTVKERVISEQQARDYKRMDLAADKYGLKVSYFKKLINEGRLTRFKLGSATLIDCNELERLITKDIGNHGREAAPQAARN